MKDNEVCALILIALAVTLGLLCRDAWMNAESITYLTMPLFPGLDFGIHGQEAAQARYNKLQANAYMYGGGAAFCLAFGLISALPELPQKGEQK